MGVQAPDTANGMLVVNRRELSVRWNRGRELFCSGCRNRQATLGFAAGRRDSFQSDVVRGRRETVRRYCGGYGLVCVWAITTEAQRAFSVPLWLSLFDGALSCR